MRLVARKEMKAKEISLTIRQGVDFLEDFDKGKDFYKVDDVVVDLTKVINDIKKFNDVNYDKISKLEEMRKTFRYLSTAKTNADKAIKEIEKKRDEARQKFKFDQYEKEAEELRRQHEQELRKLNQKFGIPEDFDENIDKYVDDPKKLEQYKKIEEEFSTNAEKTEKEAKEVVRYIREVLSEYYDLPEQLIEQVRITVKAMGAIAKVSKKASSAHIPVDVLKEIMKDPKVKEILDPFVEEIDFSDSVRIIGATLPKLGTYFGEAENKVKEILKDAEEIDVETKKKDIKEGVIGDIFVNALESVANIVKKLVNKTKGVIKSLKNNVYRDGSAIETEMEKARTGLSNSLKEHQKNYLDIEELISSASLDSIRESYNRK